MHKTLIEAIQHTQKENYKGFEAPLDIKSLAEFAGHGIHVKTSRGTESAYNYISSFGNAFMIVGTLCGYTGCFDNYKSKRRITKALMRPLKKIDGTTCESTNVVKTIPKSEFPKTFLDAAKESRRWFEDFQSLVVAETECSELGSNNKPRKLISYWAQKKSRLGFVLVTKVDAVAAKEKRMTPRLIEVVFTAASDTQADPLLNLRLINTTAKPIVVFINPRLQAPILRLIDAAARTEEGVDERMSMKFDATPRKSSFVTLQPGATRVVIEGRFVAEND
jgi:hypothetical protein